MVDLRCYEHGIYAFDAHHIRPQLAAIHPRRKRPGCRGDTANNAALPHALTLCARRPPVPCASGHAGGASAMMQAFPGSAPGRASGRARPNRPDCSPPCRRFTAKRKPVICTATRFRSAPIAFFRRRGFPSTRRSDPGLSGHPVMPAIIWPCKIRAAAACSPATSSACPSANRMWMGGPIPTTTPTQFETRRSCMNRWIGYWLPTGSALPDPFLPSRGPSRAWG